MLSNANFATKYAFDSIFQALQDLHTFAPLQSQNFSNKIGLEKPEHPLARFDILHATNQDKIHECSVFVKYPFACDPITYCLRTCQTPWHSARDRVLLPCENLSVNFPGSLWSYRVGCNRFFLLRMREIASVCKPVCFYSTFLGELRD